MGKYRKAVIATFFISMFALPLRSDTWKRISSLRYDEDHLGAITIVFEIDTSRNRSGDFTRLRVQVPQHPDFILTNDSGWVKYTSPDAELRSDLKKSVKNQVPSEYVLAVRAGDNRTLLMLFGYAYASSPGSLDVLEIGVTGLPRVVLHRDEFGLKDIRDLDGDGLAEIVGYPCLSQESGDGILTYDPFNVYQLGRTASMKAVLSVPLSKAYNLKHYYGWAGPECREDIRVVLHPSNGNRPIIVPEDAVADVVGPSRSKPKN
jgi:hypothetical protein